MPTKITARSYVIIGDAPPVPFGSLSPEKRAEYTERIMENIGNTLSRYLSEHPEEAVPLTGKYKDN